MDTIKPIRIAQIIGKMWAGGVESVVFNYYQVMDHSKIQFDIYYDSDSTIEPPMDLMEKGAKFYKLPPYQKIWRYIPKLKMYMQRGNYTIVHSHLNTLSVFPLYVAWKEGVPVRVAHSHSVPGGKDWIRNVMKMILKRASRLFATDYFACSEKAGRWLFGNKEFDSGNVTVINNAIDFSRFCVPIEKTDELKEKLEIREKFVVGHIGRFTFAKNHMKVLNVFKCIKNIQPDSILLLVGDGELHEKIMEKIEELKLSNNVICTGKVSDPQIYYSLMDVVVLPSFFEGFSLSAIEAQISGVPVIASEAVPNEACISDCFEIKSIKETDEIWAKAAISISKKKNRILEKADDYDINKCGVKLQKWYLNHAGENSND